MATSCHGVGTDQNTSSTASSPCNVLPTQVPTGTLAAHSAIQLQVLKEQAINAQVNHPPTASTTLHPPLAMSDPSTYLSSANDKKTQLLSLISHHLIYPLIARVVGAPQTISQPVSSIFLCSLLPSGAWQTQGLSIP